MNVVRNLVQSPRTQSLRSTSDLSNAGLIAAGSTVPIDAIAANLPVAITPHMAGLIDRSDPDDPIARQFVPDLAEAIVTPDELRDPIGDSAHAPVTGIVHRYPDRVLLTPILTCPVYCRFCFRRETVGHAGGLLSQAFLDQAIAYIAAHPAIAEVILTGGDPLVLSPRRLGGVLPADAGLPESGAVLWWDYRPRAAVDDATVAQDASRLAAVRTAFDDGDFGWGAARRDLWGLPAPEPRL